MYGQGECGREDRPGRRGDEVGEGEEEGAHDPCGFGPANAHNTTSYFKFVDGYIFEIIAAGQAGTTAVKRWNYPVMGKTLDLSTSTRAPHSERRGECPLWPPHKLSSRAPSDPGEATALAPLSKRTSPSIGAWGRRRRYHDDRQHDETPFSCFAHPSHKPKRPTKKLAWPFSHIERSRCVCMTFKEG